MKRLLLSFILLSLLFINTSSIAAHPGRTDGSGCHYCWTNCGKYGLEYGEYHCHDGSSTGSSSSVSDKEYIKPQQPVKDTPIYIKEDTDDTNTSSNTNNDFKRFLVYNWEWFVIGLPILEILTILYYRYKINRLNENFKKECERLEFEKSKEIYNQKLIQDKKIHDLQMEQIRKEYKRKRKSIFGKNNPYTKQPIYTEKDYIEYRLEYDKRHEDDII